MIPKAGSSEYEGRLELVELNKRMQGQRRKLKDLNDEREGVCQTQKGGGRLSGIVANHNFECTSSLKSFKSSLKPLEMNYTYLYLTYNVHYV